MNNISRTAKNILLSAGMITLFTAPAYCQVPAAKTFFSKLRGLFRPRVTAPVKTPAQTLPKGLSLAQVKALKNKPAKTPIINLSSLRPLSDDTTARVQAILAPTLRKPAEDFYGLFKQIVYAHWKNRSVTKQITQYYYYEVYVLLQHAVHLNKMLGYTTLSSYLRQHNGQMPTLMPYGSYQVTPHSRQVLVVYAGEELNNLLGKMLSRSPSKRQPTPDEWIAINTLSTMLPAPGRPVFYDLLVEKRYADLQAIALDPYLKNPDTLRRIQAQEAPVIPTKAERIAHYKKMLNSLEKEQQKLQSVLPYQQQQYAKKKVIYGLLMDNNQTKDAAAAKKEMDKASARLLRTQKRLQQVTDSAEQIRFGLRFLEGK